MFIATINVIEIIMVLRNKLKYTKYFWLLSFNSCTTYKSYSVTIEVLSIRSSKFDFLGAIQIIRDTFLLFYTHPTHVTFYFPKQLFLGLGKLCNEIERKCLLKPNFGLRNTMLNLNVTFTKIREIFCTKYSFSPFHSTFDIFARKEVKPICHIQFKHATNRVSSSKMQYNVENACVNWMWQLG